MSLHARYYTKGFNEDIEYWVVIDGDYVSVSMRFDTKGRALQVVASINNEPVRDEYGRPYDPSK